MKDFFTWLDYHVSNFVERHSKEVETEDFKLRYTTAPWFIAPIIAVATIFGIFSNQIKRGNGYWYLVDDGTFEGVFAQITPFGVRALTLGSESTEGDLIQVKSMLDGGMTFRQVYEFYLL